MNEVYFTGYECPPGLRGWIATVQLQVGGVGGRWIELSRWFCRDMGRTQERRMAGIILRHAIGRAPRWLVDALIDCPGKSLRRLEADELTEWAAHAAVAKAG